jgi:predicted nucleic acid-binding protein
MTAQFVDTNALLYAISREAEEQPKAKLANALLDRGDAAIIEAARSLGCEVVLTEDLGDGQDYAGVRVENPFRLPDG